MGRAAQGVRLINLKGNAEIAAVARVPRSDEEEDQFDEDGNPIAGFDSAQSAEGEGSENNSAEGETTENSTEE
jgi:DNA gyrase subunit A